MIKFSIITPTNNIKYLTDLYNSLLDQLSTEWEWVIYLNNGPSRKDLPYNIVYDSRVKVYEETEPLNSIGAIKARAFSKASGAILVEVDHDDMLLPTCLEKLEEAFEDEEIGFVYSDSIVEGEFTPYGKEYGWTHSIVKGKVSMNSFPPTSHSLSYIWFAPDHIRAWRASEYKRLGGHNPNLGVCDDHDLCIRTYLYSKMKQIKEPLYVYRVTGNNTYLERNEEIQTVTRNLFDFYVRALAEKDADDKDLLKIDIGGGLYPYKDYKTVDIRNTADYVADLNDKFPLEDNSVGVLNASHILEHLKDPIHSMKEIYRVLEHGGWAFIEVPSTEGRGAYQDPTHVSFWNENSFLYYTNSAFAEFIDSPVRFQVYKLTTYFPSKEFKDLNIPVTCAVLVAIKKDTPRFPGLLNI